MTTDELVAAVVLKATGRNKDLKWGDKNYKKILGIANFYISSWQNEPEVDWASLYDPEYSIGATRNTRRYELDRSEVNKISDMPGDYIMVGNEPFQTVTANQLKRYEGGNVCAVAGEYIIFGRDFTGGELGKTIKVPVYLKAETLKGARSVVPVDDPYWLVTICAAEYARSDILLQNQYSNLITEANQLMKKMIENNSAQVAYVQKDHIPGVSDI